MTIGGIGQGYGTNPYSRGYGIESDDTAKKTAEEKKAVAASSYPSAQTLQDLAGIAASAMDAMGIPKNGNVTFGQISAYKEKLEKEYGDKLKTDLEKLGVDKDIKFQLKLGKNGSMEVVSDHPDKAKVQKYFDDNPDMVKKYKEIQSLADLDNARKNMQMNPTDLRKRIQVESLAAWWDQGGNGGSSIGDFSGGDMAFYKGINATV